MRFLAGFDLLESPSPKRSGKRGRDVRVVVERHVGFCIALGEGGNGLTESKPERVKGVEPQRGGRLEFRRDRVPCTGEGFKELFVLSFCLVSTKKSGFLLREDRRGAQGLEGFAILKRTRLAFASVEPHFFEKAAKSNREAVLFAGRFGADGREA